jgi:hypothetical protein
VKQLARLVNYVENPSHQDKYHFAFYYAPPDRLSTKRNLYVSQWTAILGLVEEESSIWSEGFSELEEALDNLIEACLKQGWNIVDAITPEEIAYFANIERLIQLLQEKLLALEGCDALFFEYLFVPTFSLPKWSGSIDCGSHWQSMSIAKSSGEDLLTVCEALLKQLHNP